MKRHWRIGAVAALLAVAAVGLIVGSAMLAQVIGPPGVIGVRPVANNVTKYNAVAVDELRDYAYVLHGRAVSIFAGTEITKTFSDFGSPLRVAVDASQGYAYVTQELNAEVRVIQEKSEVGTVSLGSRPGAIEVLTTTGRAYVALPDAGAVAVLNGAAEVPPRIGVGHDPTALSVNPADGRVYVANRGSKTVSVILGHTVEATLTMAMTPTALAIHPDTGLLYVSHSSDDRLSVWDSGALTLTVVVTESGQIAVDASSGLVYVLSSDTRDIFDRKGWVHVFDGTSLLRQIPLDDGPRAVAVDAKSGYAYVALGSGDTGAVAVLQGTVLVETLPMGQTPRGVAVNPNLENGVAYVPVHNQRIVLFGRTETYVTDPIGAGDATTLNCVGTHGLPVTVQVPVGAVPSGAGEVQVICSALNEADTAPDFVWVGQAFRLRVYQDGANLPDFAFAKPVTLTVAYGEAWLSGIAEEKLELRAQTGGIAEQQWELTGIALVDRQPGADQVVATITYPADHALVGELLRLYMPLLMRE